MFHGFACQYSFGCTVTTSTPWSPAPGGFAAFTHWTQRHLDKGNARGSKENQRTAGYGKLGAMESLVESLRASS